ncbi:MAG TPA: glycosyltransferase [Rhabdochlamydiaceae bacterium]|jgi:glycosyltransferase involved in cell wall biosynthesis|nr:glycosyltransferase [Rhabdochlamydiaceae bacterium]
MKKKFIKGGVLFVACLIPLVLVFIPKKSKIASKAPLTEKPFVIVVPSYNNAAFCEQNILSVLHQQYENYRVIFIDDASKDDTYDKVKALVDRSPKKKTVVLIKNNENQGSLKNLYTAIHSCKDHEIIVRVDGDDQLAHPFVLKKLNKVYADSNIWMTYGNYLDTPTYKQKPQLCQKFPKSVLKSQRFRQYKWVTSHLHTFYAGLFKKISPDHLTKDGQFLPVAGDVAIILPMLEMASSHFQFIEDVLYLYNRSNPLSDHLSNRLVLQNSYDRYVRSLPSYPPLEHPPYE